jgi:hypothetical protein
MSGAQAQWYGRNDEPIYARRGFVRGPQQGYYVPQGAPARGVYITQGGTIVPLDSFGQPRRHGDALRRRAKEQLRKAPPPPPVKGPLLIAISIADQKLTLYDDGVPIATSKVSTGTPGHLTPTGVFAVIGKERFHRSNLYSAAPMPFMQRITWSGVAIHAGVLPGYPASHGCIRLPTDFAIRLYHTTKIGARVIISQHALAPTDIVNARLFAPKPAIAPAATTPVLPPTSAAAAGTAMLAKAELQPVGAQVTRADNGSAPALATAEATADAAAQPPPQPAAQDKAGDLRLPEAPPAPSTASRLLPVKLRSGAVSVFVSRKERRLFVRKGFEPLFDMPVEISDVDRPLGTHVFTLMEMNGDKTRWSVVSMPPERPVLKRERPRHYGKHAKVKTAEIAVDQPKAATASAALDRIVMPQEAIDAIAPLLSVGASLIISDKDRGPETGLETDFVVLTHS